MYVFCGVIGVFISITTAFHYKDRERVCLIKFFLGGRAKEGGEGERGRSRDSPIKSKNTYICDKPLHYFNKIEM